MVYSDSDDGPFYLDLAERVIQKFDKPTGKIEKRKFNKKELQAKLVAKGVTAKGVLSAVV